MSKILRNDAHFSKLLYPNVFMSINPHELATLLFESCIPHEVKMSLVNDFLPKMTTEDIYNLYEILSHEKRESAKMKGDFEKSLRFIQKQILKK